MSVMAALAMARSVPGAHGDADIRRRQGRRIVHAVAHHRHALASGDATPYGRSLLVRAHTAFGIGDANLRGQVLYDGRCIA